jgi:hypothetical protein
MTDNPQGGPPKRFDAPVNRYLNYISISRENSGGKDPSERPDHGAAIHLVGAARFGATVLWVGAILIMFIIAVGVVVGKITAHNAMGLILGCIGAAGVAIVVLLLSSKSGRGKSVRD